MNEDLFYESMVMPRDKKAKRILNMTTPTCQKCELMRWHPYPEEKPSYDTDYFVQLRRFCQQPTREVMAYSKGEFMENDEEINLTVESWAEIQYPDEYTPPPKKKTVRVSREAIIKTFKNNSMIYLGILPEVFEIEVDLE